MVPVKSLMLTGDENIVDAQMIVQYRVSDPIRYLFHRRDPECYDFVRSLEAYEKSLRIRAQSSCHPTPPAQVSDRRKGGTMMRQRFGSGDKGRLPPVRVPTMGHKGKTMEHYR